MGFDTSYHPIDRALVEERLLPYVRGEARAIDDLVAEAVRIGRVRFRANAWGLGALATRHEGIAPWLHVWGRPFFITVDGAAELGATIDRYLAARDEAAVDAIARDMLAVIDPALADRVSPSTEGRLPDDAAAARGIRFRVDLMRAAWAARSSGRPVTTPDGREFEARSLLGRELPFTLLELQSHLRPGWMDRGLWPTALLEAAKVPAEVLGRWFVAPRLLVGDAIAREVDCFLHAGIVENDMVGGRIEAPATVGEVAGVLERNLDRVGEEGRGSVRKMIEAMRDAERRGMPFCEATEIYSGFAGVMN